MKKLLLPILGLFLLAFAVVNGDFQIQGTANGLEGKTIVFRKQDEKLGLVAVDSAKVVNGKFSWKGKVTEPEIYFAEIKDSESRVAFILESGKIEITLLKDSIGSSIIGGTQNNKDLQGFNVKAMTISRKIQKFQETNNEKMQQAQKSNDTATVNSLMKEFGNYQKELMNLAAEFPKKNPKSFISVLFVDNMFNAPDVDIEEIKKVYNSLDAKIRATKPGLKVLKKIQDYRSVNIGDQAPDFSAASPEGKTISLKESLGKVTIIDFWASWCGPCRRENPNVVKLYNEFHAKGLNIIGVSLDKDAAKWKEAIEKDQLAWPHISNLMFWDEPIAATYGVKSIPATFILDENGKIIARDLRGEELRAKIASILK